MRIYDIIAKKRDKHELNQDEIKFFVNSVVKGNVDDCQISAFLMAIFLNGMTDDETTLLTKNMVNSGEIADLSGINGIKVDKHSTGGVGDKTSLIISPIVAACGVPVAKMSGRGLGHAGGTIDKLESIPGLKTSLNREDFFKIVNNVGCAIVSQTGDLVPVDKKLYSIRDITATVESLELIASSIMSKKIASGADCILLDVKTGSGAYVKSREQAVKLAKLMVNIGNQMNKKTVALVTNMDKPLGNAVGNFIEVMEVCEILNGQGPDDLRELSLELSANMLYLANKGSLSCCKSMAKNSLDSGLAFKKFKEMISAQGGNVKILGNPKEYFNPKFECELRAKQSGYITIDSQRIGISSMVLGAGREKKGDSIDPMAGIKIFKKTGEYVNSGDVLAILYSKSLSKIEHAKQILTSSIEVKPEISQYLNSSLIFERVEYSNIK